MKRFEVLQRVQWVAVFAVLLWILSVALALSGASIELVAAVAAGGLILAVLHRSP